METYPTTSSPKWSSLIRILILLFVAIVVFWAGMSIGYKKAQFSNQLGNRYLRAFDRLEFEDRGPMNGMMGTWNTDRIPGGHGAAGKVIAVNLPTIVVSDPQGFEKIIHIDTDTIIRSARESVSSTTVRTDDFVVIIGTPAQNGEITAKLIRIMPPTPLQGFPTTTPYKTR